MQTIDNGLFIKLVADVGHLIYSQHTNTYHNEVYLGKNDNVKFYLEVIDEDYKPENTIDATQIMNVFEKTINEGCMTSKIIDTTQLVDIFEKTINE